MSLKKIATTVGIVVLSLILVSAAVELYVRTIQVEQVGYSDLRWEQTPGLIALRPYTKNKERGLLFIRLRDGGEQFMNGEWNTDFTTYGNVFVYGYPPIESGEKKQRLYYIESGEKISRIDIKNSPGEIVSIQENPKTSYLFIEFINDKKTAFCVVERYGLGDTSCQQLDVNKIARGTWNPKKERELVIMTADKEIYTFDPWEKRPVKIAKSDTAYQELHALFNARDQARPAHEGAFQLSLFNILLTKHAAAFSLFRIPWGARTAWIIDTNHILLTTKSVRGILELSTKKYVPFIFNAEDAPPIIEY